jgi:hypothetical protein
MNDVPLSVVFCRCPICYAHRCSSLGRCATAPLDGARLDSFVTEHFCVCSQCVQERAVPRKHGQNTWSAFLWSFWGNVLGICHRAFRSPLAQIQSSSLLHALSSSISCDWRCGGDVCCTRACLAKQHRCCFFAGVWCRNAGTRHLGACGRSKWLKHMPLFCPLHNVAFIR